MARFFRRLLGFILLLSTMGLATCQSMLKAEPVAAIAYTAQQQYSGKH